MYLHSQKNIENIILDVESNKKSAPLVDTSPTITKGVKEEPNIPLSSSLIPLDSSLIPLNSSLIPLDSSLVPHDTNIVDSNVTPAYSSWNVQRPLGEIASTVSSSPIKV